VVAGSSPVGPALRQPLIDFGGRIPPSEGGLAFVCVDFCPERRNSFMAESNLKKFLKKVKVNESAISTLLGALVIIVIGALIFNYFKNIEKPAEEAPTTVEETQGEVKLVEEEGEQIPEALPTTYQVQSGDNLWKIAEKFYGSGYNWVDIAGENSLNNPDQLNEGQSLNIPRTAVIKAAEETGKGGEAVNSISGESYTVLKGDSLWDIAVRAYGDGYRWPEIARANNLVNPGVIHTGNTLTLPR
jgi:LysM repeat protein